MGSHTIQQLVNILRALSQQMLVALLTVVNTYKYKHLVKFNQLFSSLHLTPPVVDNQLREYSLVVTMVRRGIY